MATTIGLAGGAGAKPSPQDIQSHMERLIADPGFRASPRRRDFLRFIVGETLAGRADRLKGYTIALAVFGRDETFDQRADPVVRIEARRLRRDLDSYYGTRGSDEAVRISIPTGGYVPHFEWQGGAAPAELLADGAGAATEPEVRPPPAPARRLPLRPRAAALAACAIVLVAATVAWLWPRNAAIDEANARGPAMAVLPFEVLVDSDDAEIFAAGLVQQLVTDLMRFPGLRLYVMPPVLGSAGAAGPVDLEHRLDVDYVVAGSVASGASDVRIGAQLVDVRSGEVLWSEAYDRDLTPQALLGAQADLAAAIATELGQPYGIVQTDVARRMAEGSGATMPSYSCVLEASIYRRSFQSALHASVLACLEAAVARDPDYAEAWALLGWLRMDGARFGLVPEQDRDRAFQQAFAAASRALALDPSNITALKALSSITYYAGDHAEAERLQRRALELNPNDPDTLAQLGWRLAARGNWEEGIPYLERAIDRTVNPPGWYHHLIAVDHYLRGDHAAMLDAARRSTIDGSGPSWSLLAIAQGALGDGDAAHASLREMARSSPRMARDPAAVYAGHQLIESTVERLVEGLRNAGWTPSGVGLSQ
jgi:TolB-like protein